MANIHATGEKALRIEASIADALAMVQEASKDVPKYASDIVTIFDKMPVFDYTSFCFYAYDSAALFEWMLKMNPREYLSFSMDAPDSFFYVLYGGVAGLYEQAKKHIADMSAAHATVSTS